ncbi:MAG: TonB-dependent receptor [Terricaulis sp.]|nr:TonB-dependent receptor [Terricaulis sp.]
MRVVRCSFRRWRGGDGAAQRRDVAGQNLGERPRWNASTSLVYNTEFGAFPFGLRADVIYRGESYADAANRATLAPVTRVNLAATLGIGLVDFRFFVRDLFDNDEAMGAASSPTSCVYGVGLPSSFVTASAIEPSAALR